MVHRNIMLYHMCRLHSYSLVQCATNQPSAQLAELV